VSRIASARAFIAATNAGTSPDACSARATLSFGAAIVITQPASASMAAISA